MFVKDNQCVDFRGYVDVFKAEDLVVIRGGGGDGGYGTPPPPVPPPGV